MSLIAPRPSFALNCRGTPLMLGTRTCIMGILNTTPDSFADGGLYLDPAKAVDHALEMAEAGAGIIDIGGESSRPAGPYGTGAKPVSTEEELRRTLPIIKAIAPRLSIPISIDTTKASVAHHALDAGASIVNDISALRFDPDMPVAVAKSGAGLILMHMQGTPRTMQIDPVYGNLIGEIRDFLSNQIQVAISAGISRTQIAIDPGLGFGKTHAHNREIIARLPEFHTLNCPILMGPSRKKFTAPQAQPSDRLPGTLAALVLCVTGGAHIVRVHDVAAANQVIAFTDQMRKTP